MSLAETVLLIGGFAVMGWYVVTYVLPNLPQGGQFTEGNTAEPAGTATPGPFPNNTCKAGNNGITCYRAIACGTSAPVNGISYRNKSVSWCVKGSCDSAKNAWTSLFKCVASTPKPVTPPKKLNPPATTPKPVFGPTPGLNCTCGAGYVRDIAGTNASKCVCKKKPVANTSGCAGLLGATLDACIKTKYCAGLTGATQTACVNAHK